ncbi:MAG: hypothetical protein QXI22_07215 [Sulfolobales archaeon]
MKIFIAALILTLALTALLANAEVSQGDFDARVGEALARLERFNMKTDIDGIVARLGEAVRLWESGKRDEALRVVDGVNAEISGLEERAWVIEVQFYLGLAVRVLAFLSLPLIVYFGLPRVYLRLWYYFRRRWLVASRR